MLDLRSLLAGAQLTAQEVSPSLASYFNVVDQGADAVLLFDPAGHGGGSAVAVLQGLGSTVTNVNTLLADGAIRTT